MAGLPQLNSFVSKFLNLWQSGCDASLHLETHAGKATVHLQVGLGHAPPPSAPPSSHRRVPGPSRQRRTQRRALARAHAEEARAKSDAENVEEAKSDAENVEEANEAAEGAVEIDVAAKATTDDVTAANATESEVNDEFCPNDVYNKADDIRKTSFRCHSCRMLFLPESYSDGDEILNFESCRAHIGVAKCGTCAIVLVGPAQIRCHRQVCLHSA